MLFGFQDGKCESIEVNPPLRPEIAELPDSSGELPNLAELPDSSGEMPQQLELPDSSGEVPPQTKSPDDLQDSTDVQPSNGLGKNFVDNPDDSEDTIEDAKSETDSSEKLKADFSEKESEVSDTSQNKEISEDDNADQRMEPPAYIEFSCPDNCDKEEYQRQVGGQQEGLNKLTIGQYLRNREAYINNGRNTDVGGEAQRRAREEARVDKIRELRLNNPDMTLEEAEKQADEWLKSQAALHDPDQIAGGNPEDVTGIGDAKVNSSIGAQWRDRVSELDKQVQNYIDNNNILEEDYNKIKLNVNLTVI